MNKKRSKLFYFFLFSFLITIVLMALVLIYIDLNLNKEIDLNIVRAGSSSITKVFYYNKDEFGNITGEPIELKEEQIFLDKNEWCSYYDMPKNLINAFVAIEDHRFFEHNGVDWLRSGKAALTYILNMGKSEFGGSTITQQLVKNITGDNKRTPKRKIEEILRSLYIEKNIGKIQILELYLNIVYLSENCYGVNSASEIYFDKKPNELSLAECATLASIVKSPSKFDPYINIDNNKSRRNIVLAKMLEHNMITNDEYYDAINEEIVINPKIENEKRSGVFSWYTEALIDDLVRDLMKKYNLSREGALMVIYKGGLNIYSPIDPELQKHAEKVFENYKAYINSQNGAYPNASCVIMDPYSSDVIAIIGGVGSKKENRILNRATKTLRPLGSVIKPLSVYAPAIEKGYLSYSTVFDDVPMSTNDEIWPKNSPDVYHGLVDLDYSISHSLNTVSIQSLRLLGVKNSYEFLTNELDFRLSQNDKNEAPLGLGQLTNGESLINVTRAYTMFQNRGFIGNSRTYYKVTDNYGNVILENKKEYKKVISDDTSSLMNHLLSGVTRYGTAKYSLLKDVINFAGKTGTSGNSYDKWFVGYTPYYVCGVWVGFDTPTTITQGGKSPAVNLFDALMLDAHKEKNKNFNLYTSNNIVEVEYCTDSGCLPLEECRLDPRLNRIKKGYFIKGSEPKEICKLHKSVYIDSQSGMIANNDTSYLLKRKIALLDFTRENKFDNIEILDEKYTIENRSW